MDERINRMKSTASRDQFIYYPKDEMKIPDEKLDRIFKLIRYKEYYLSTVKEFPFLNEQKFFVLKKIFTMFTDVNYVCAYTDKERMEYTKKAVELIMKTDKVTLEMIELATHYDLDYYPTCKSLSVLDLENEDLCNYLYGFYKLFMDMQMTSKFTDVIKEEKINKLKEAVNSTTLLNQLKTNIIYNNHDYSFFYLYAITAMIIAYCFNHDDTYSYLANFLNNTEYYIEKLGLNDLLIDDVNGFYTTDKCKQLYYSIPSIFANMKYIKR